jgi:hypothetical protein
MRWKMYATSIGHVISRLSFLHLIPECTLLILSEIALFYITQTDYTTFQGNPSSAVENRMYRDTKGHFPQLKAWNLILSRSILRLTDLL